MANPAERRTDYRVTDLSGGRRVDVPPSNPEPSVPAALEKIATASQRVLSKRIDLLMLDNHEMISRLLVKAAALSVGVVAGLAAWMSARDAHPPPPGRRRRRRPLNRAREPRARAAPAYR